MNVNNLYVENVSDSENSFCNVTAGCYLIQDGLTDENSGVIPIYHSICKLVPRKNGFDSTIGLVLECRGIDCYVLWTSESNPRGWWRRDQLRVFKSAIKP